MDFRVVDQRLATSLPNTPCVLLERRRWDDYGYKTLFHAYYVAGEGEHQFLGPVKILERDKLRPEIDPEFTELPERFCSLGQDLSYYYRIRALGEDASRTILGALQDVVYSPVLEAAWKEAQGFETSLLRLSGARTALAEGRSYFPSVEEQRAAAMTLELSFTTKFDEFDGPHALNLVFIEGDGQLGRIMTLIGKNGTGKTRLLAQLAETLSGLKSDEKAVSHRPSGVIALSFSAFDRFTRPVSDSLGTTYRYYGLRAPTANPKPAEQSEAQDTAREVARKPRRERDGRVDVEVAFDLLGDSLRCIQRMSGDEGDKRRKMWLRLMDEVGFFEAEPLAPNPFEENSVDAFVDVLERASSGYQLLAFAISGLMESLREKTLVLFDEPELHLHPSMIGSLVRALYEALEEFGAYALLATHSPIVLQEIPARSVRTIECIERIPRIKPYARESFGANLSEIVRTAFGVDEEEKNYVAILKKLAATKQQEEVEALFNDLGVGVRMLIRDIYQKQAAR